jgi:transposase-like protein
MRKKKSLYHGHRFPAVVISCAVRWYFADIPELAHVKHVFVKAAARVNNRAENSHQPTRRRERSAQYERVQGFIRRGEEQGVTLIVGGEAYVTYRTFCTIMVLRFHYEMVGLILPRAREHAM